MSTILKWLLFTSSFCLAFSGFVGPVFASCYDNTQYYGSASKTYKTKNFSNKANTEDIDATVDLAVRSAWDDFVASCFEGGQLQEYLNKKDSVLGDINKFISIDQTSEKINKKDKLVEVEVLVTINKKLIDGLFTQASSASAGGGSLLVTIFAARQASFVKDSQTTILDPNVTKRNESKDLQTSESVADQDDTSVVESNQTVSKSQTRSSGVTVTGGNETTAVERDFVVVSSADIETKTSEVLSINGFEPIGYTDLVNECGGAEPEVVEAELALNGKMLRETRKSVLISARDCGIELFATGTIDISIPKKSSVEGYSVIVSVSGIVEDITSRFPKKVAVIGPIQANAAAPTDQAAIREALKIAAEAAANEIVSRLNAKGIN
tara:strand:+ start:202 stop:1344 length:1143 start_codon:yes stop_codon:yes gene_type:complete